MASTHPILGFVRYAWGLAFNGWHTENDANLVGLGVVTQLSVLSRTVTAQPGSPAAGDCYIIPTGATGAQWSGQAKKVAAFIDAAWKIYTPNPGWSAWVKDEGFRVNFTGVDFATGSWNLTVRQVLTANRSYFVNSSTGNDSNSGLGSGTAFLTIQKAIDVASMLDLSIYDVTINLVGTFNLTAEIICKGALGAGRIKIVGDVATPANVPITLANSGGSSIAIFSSVENPTIYEIRGVTLSATGTTASFGLRAAGSYILFDSIDFGSFTTTSSQQIRAEKFGKIEAGGNYTISGGAGRHWSSNHGEVRVQSRTVTINNTPAFAPFAAAEFIGGIIVNGNTFVGSATGVRYSAIENSVIKTNGGGATYLPGDAAGTTATGGQYI